MRRGRPTRRLLVAAVAACLLVLAFMHAGTFLSSPASSPAKADAVVVLGGDAGARSLKGVELYRQGYTTHVLLTGVEDGEQGIQQYYLNWRAQIFLRAGVNREQILFDAVSRNSWEEAESTLRLMKKKGWRHVLVVSDPPHMRRLSRVWGKVFKDSGLRYTLVAGVPSWWRADRWWSNEPSAKFVVNEYVKLGYYFFAH